MTVTFSREYQFTTFQLIPFEPTHPAIEITGSLQRRQEPIREEQDDRVILSYRLKDGKRQHQHDHIDPQLHPEQEIARRREQERKLAEAQKRDLLQLSFRLTGDLSQIQLPGLTTMPQRRDELWQHTCFEFFLGVPGNPGYWEFNLSPSGDWNVYQLSNYRENLRPEPAFTDLPFTVVVTESFCLLTLELDLGLIVQADQAIEVGLTTVIEERSKVETETGQISYWALEHTGPEADFHRRDSFTIQLAGV